jgi:hypothetical protein
MKKKNEIARREIFGGLGSNPQVRRPEPKDAASKLFDSLFGG